MARARFAILVILAIQLLAACGAGTPAERSSILHVEGSLNPSSDLLYLSNGEGLVYMFALPAGTPAGQCSVDFGAAGMCTDAANNVFITEPTGGAVVEYAHGGTTQIGKLSDVLGRPTGCAFDSHGSALHGTIAVTSYSGPRIGDPGNVAFYQNETGAPTFLADSDFLFYFFCTYDGNGDLFIDGQDKYLKPLIAELPKAGKRFVTLHTSGFPGSFHYPSGLVWDGTYLDIGDYDRSVIYRLKISGRSASVAQKVSLLQGSGLEQFTLYNDQGTPVVIGPNNQGTTSMLWPFPKGGPPETAWYIRTNPTGSVVSYGSSSQNR